MFGWLVKRRSLTNSKGIEERLRVVELTVNRIERRQYREAEQVGIAAEVPKPPGGDLLGIPQNFYHPAYPYLATHPWAETSAGIPDQEQINGAEAATP